MKCIDTVLNRFGGSICGEHGDGRIRAEYVRKMFGEELYSLFVEVKHLFDPSGVLNPGIKISEDIVHRAYRLYEAIKILRDLCASAIQSVPSMMSFNPKI